MSGKPRVYITRDVRPIALEILKDHVEIAQWESEEVCPYEEILKNVPGIDALFCLLTDKIDKKVMDTAGPQLKTICTMSVGFEHIDMEECKKRGILVGNTPNVSTDEVAEFGLTLLLGVARRLREGAEAVKAGEWRTWKPMFMCGYGLLNSTVGIVGLGRIGMGVGQRVKAFGTKEIIYSDACELPYAGQIGAKFATFDEVCERSDFIVATCALLPTTAGIFNKRAFEKMKKSVIFVNVSRGGVVNHDDLYEALSTGQICGAGIDVTVPEPIPTDHPLLTLPNCVVTPHIGSATMMARDLMAELTAKNIVAALNGQPMPGKVEV